MRQLLIRNRIIILGIAFSSIETNEPLSEVGDVEECHSFSPPYPYCTQSHTSEDSWNAARDRSQNVLRVWGRRRNCREGNDLKIFGHIDIHT